MSRFACGLTGIILCCSIAAATAHAQGAAKSQAQPPAKAQAADPAAPVRQALTQAQSGRCTEALPVLKRSAAGVTDKQLRYFAAFATVQCGMSVNDTAAVLNALVLLQRDFPDDPEVLFTAARIYAQFSDRAAQALVQRFPTSVQVARLNAEALESKQMWKEAIDAYRKILAQDPKVHGIHYRIATILLDTSSTAETAAEAKKELEAELQLDPENASAVFALGEIARRAGAWDEAIRQFTRAAQLDVGFMEAYFSLGVSFIASGKYAEAIPPLERYVKGVPEDPAGHYQLALAYSRTGNKTGADRELKLQQELLAKKKLAWNPGSAGGPPAKPPVCVAVGNSGSLPDYPGGTPMMFRLHSGGGS